MKVNQQPIVRHYRGASRADVEEAYRADAQPAIRAGYRPVNHQWTQDRDGLLLAVTYELTPVAPPPVRQAAPQAARAEAPAANPFLTAATASGNEQFVAQQQGRANQFAPARADAAPGSIDAQWIAPAPAPAPAQAPAPAPARYQPPPDMYRAPNDLYAPPSQPQQAQYEQPIQPAQYAQPDQYAQPAQYAQPPVQPQQQYVQPPQEYVQPPQEYVQPGVAAAAQVAVPVGPALEQAQPAPAPPADAAPQAQPAPDARVAQMTVQTLDLHCAGEPLRIIRSGFPDVPHLPVLERRRWVMENADHVRRAIIQEPRGHRDMYGAILLPPYNDYADMTVLFMHNEGYSTMCGHGIIAITTGLIEEGLYPASEPVTTIRYEAPAGIVAANAATVQLEDGSWAVRGVRFTNVPSYLAAQSLAVRPDGVQLYGPSAQYGALSVDIGFGGAYYGIVNAADLGLRVVPEQAEALRRAGAAITELLRRDHTPQHPTDAALGFVYGTIIVDMDPRTSPDGRATDAHLRNVTIFADAELDRSPCGSGTSALLAQLHARGRMRVGQEIVNAGITGEHFLGRIEAETALGPYRAVSTSIAGTAYVTGYSTFVVDGRDPLGDGFLLS
ncbi:MAG TPA: proline racemase family protein [Candidatus Limnocylindrales bacterium]|nr:proline racemase family protein [Candidatus Limnocylindrales bacterium]